MPTQAKDRMQAFRNRKKATGSKTYTITLSSPVTELIERNKLREESYSAFFARAVEALTFVTSYGEKEATSRNSTEIFVTSYEDEKSKLPEEPVTSCETSEEEEEDELATSYETGECFGKLYDSRRAECNECLSYRGCFDAMYPDAGKMKALKKEARS
jgi:hypothetical protein